MKRLLALLTALSLMAPLFGAPAESAQVVITKPASEDVPQVSEPLPPPLTEKSARLAAMMAVAFENLPESSFDKEDSKVVWTLKGQFKLEGVRYDRFSAFFQTEDRTYAGVDFAKQEGDKLTLQGFELETPEPPVRSPKVKVVEKDQSSKSFFVFDLGEIERSAMKTVNEMRAKRQN